MGGVWVVAWRMVRFHGVALVTRRPGIAALAFAVMAGSACAPLGFGGECGGNEVIANFEQVGDLVVAANVQSSDVVVGTIDEIELDGWEARVTMCLQPDEKISSDARAVIRTTSLLGEKFVDLQARSPGPPYLEDGDVLTVDDTGKANELEDVFAQLAAILGSGNLEELNRFTAAQARILKDNAQDFRKVLRELADFTGVLHARRDEIGAAIDSLGAVSQTAVGDARVLEDFLSSFAGASGVLADQRQGLEDLLQALDEFTRVSVTLLGQTERGLNRQLTDLRPILRTAVNNSEDLIATLRTLATFTQWWPESMPGDYLQLDVCQAEPEYFGQGLTCPQSDQGGAGASSSLVPQAPGGAIELIMKQPLKGRG